MVKLQPQWRLVSLFMAMLCLAPAVAGRLLVPAIWSVPVLQPLLRPCAFRTLTGEPCLLCGATRAMVLAAHGAWSASLQLHPAGVVLVLGGGMLATWLALCGLSGLDLGVTRAWRLLTRPLPGIGEASPRTSTHQPESASRC